MRVATIAIAAATCAAACSSECPGELAPGSYLVRLEYRTGTCNDEPIEGVWVNDGAPVSGDDCVTLADESDACGEAVDEACDEYNDFGQYIGTSDWAWSLDYVGGGAEGVLQLAVDTTQNECYGTYDVTITPL
jgi:hypothetical protein